jgi:hypothetical protein
MKFTASVIAAVVAVVAPSASGTSVCHDLWNYPQSTLQLFLELGWRIEFAMKYYVGIWHRNKSLTAQVWCGILFAVFHLEKYIHRCPQEIDAAINFIHQSVSDINLIVNSVLTSSMSWNLYSHFNTAFSTAGFSRSVAKTAAVSGSVVSKVRVFLLVKFDISLNNNRILPNV